MRRRISLGRMTQLNAAYNLLIGQKDYILKKPRIVYSNIVLKFFLLKCLRPSVKGKRKIGTHTIATFSPAQSYSEPFSYSDFDRGAIYALHNTNKFILHNTFTQQELSFSSCNNYVDPVRMWFPAIPHSPLTSPSAMFWTTLLFAFTLYYSPVCFCEPFTVTLVEANFPNITYSLQSLSAQIVSHLESVYVSFSLSLSLSLQWESDLMPKFSPISHLNLILLNISVCFFKLWSHLFKCWPLLKFMDYVVFCFVHFINGCVLSSNMLYFITIEWWLLICEFVCKMYGAVLNLKTNVSTGFISG